MTLTTGPTRSTRLGLATAGIAALGIAALVAGIPGPAEAHAASAVPALASPPVLHGSYQRVDSQPDGDAPKEGVGSGSISADGRYTVFSTGSHDLTARDPNNHSPDIFLYDARTGLTTLVSHTAAGAAGDGQSLDATISSDGRYVSYSTYATDLPGADDTYGEVIYRYDVATGVNRLVTTEPRTTDLSQGASGTISATGRYIAFATTASMLPADTDGDGDDSTDVYLWDGRTGRLTLVSAGPDGAATGGASLPEVDARGDVSFVSTAPDSAGPSDAGPSDAASSAYLWSHRTHRTLLVSRTDAGVPLTAWSATVSDNGRVVTMNSADAVGQSELYVYDVCRHRLRQVVDPADARPGVSSTGGPVSSSGRYLLYEATTLSVSQAGFTSSTEIYDLRTGRFAVVTDRADVVPFALSGDGRHLGFDSTATDLDPRPDTNGRNDIFLWSAS